MAFREAGLNFKTSDSGLIVPETADNPGLGPGVVDVAFEIAPATTDGWVLTTEGGVVGWAPVPSTGGGGIPQGGPLTADLDANGFGITDLPDPSNPQDVATKAYVDAQTGSTSGNVELVYRYKVTGSDKASIDTGVDTADAGTNDWTNGDVLEAWILARTDEAAAVASALDITFNNDAGANYDLQNNIGVNTTTAAGASVAQNGVAMTIHGAGGAANYATVLRFTIPFYTATTFYKTGELQEGFNDSTAASNRVQNSTFTYRSTSAITRAKIACRSTNKFKVGTEIAFYKRVAS